MKSHSNRSKLVSNPQVLLVREYKIAAGVAYYYYYLPAR